MKVEYVQREVSLNEHISAVLDSPTACTRLLRRLGEMGTAERFTDDGKWQYVGDELARAAGMWERPEPQPHPKLEPGWWLRNGRA